MTETFKNLHMCGHIFSSASYSFFALQCSDCNTMFDQWNSFLRHMDQDHLSFNGGGQEQKSNGENMHGFTLENTPKSAELKSPHIAVGHSIFLESKEVRDIDDSKADEVLIDIFQVTGSKNETINISSPENCLVRENCSLSPAVANVGERVKFKKFRFNLNDSEYLPMSLDFLRVFENHQLLWNKSNAFYRNRSKRSLAKSKIICYFKEKQINISNKIILSTISTILANYELAKQEKSEKSKVRPETAFLLQKCGFLDGSMKIDLSKSNDILSSEAVDEEERFYDKYCPPKPANFIPFTENEPIFEDFIELYKDNPVLWDSSLFNYKNKADRKETLASWSKHFMSKYGIQLTNDEISYSILEFRRIYYKHLQRRETNTESDLFANFILEKGSFLPPKNFIQAVKCQHCSKIFHQDHTLKRHIYLDHGIGNKPFKCGFCEESFEDYLVQRRHEQRYHYKNYKYICEYCTKAFFTRNELQLHLVKHTGEMRFVCELCGRGFVKKANLNNHNTRVHLRQRNYPCSMCPKAFYTKGLLQDHINAHLNIRDKICPTCGKGFASHHSLIRHKQIHAVIKKYACKLCDARFHQFVGLNSHMKNKHKFVNGKNEADNASGGITTY